MDREEQLRWERDNAQWAAAAAALSAILTLAAGAYLLSKVKSGGDDAVEQIKVVQAHKTDLLVGSILTSIGTALLAAPLYYLFRATRARREQLPAGIKYLVIFAPILAAVMSAIFQLQRVDILNKLVGDLPLEVKIAEDRIKEAAGHGSSVVVGGLGTAAGLGMAFMFILISLNAMRAGLLSRFMGILGIIVGVLLVIPLQGNLPVVQVFFLGAMAALFLNRWPQGRGPAWASGTEIPWPSAAEKRDELMGGEGAAARIGGRGRVRPEPEMSLEDELDDVVEERQHTGEAARPRASTTHPRSKKRKRKRRG